jgi:hypothetical protein
MLEEHRPTPWAQVPVVKAGWVHSFTRLFAVTRSALSERLDLLQAETAIRALVNQGSRTVTPGMRDGLDIE